MPKVAIVAALEREVRPLVSGWQVAEKEYSGRHFRFFVKGETVVVCGGIGAEAARRAAEAVISIFSPALIYSAGFAGALDATLKVGAVLQPKRVVNARDGSSAVVEGGEGVLVTFSSVVDPAQKAKLRESFGAAAVDMEASAVARAAETHGISFAVIKAISDEANFEFPSTEQFVDAEGKFNEGRFAIFAALRPWLWPGVIRLARNSKQASRTLSAALKSIDTSGLHGADVPAAGVANRL
jgi:adenosylhomocysteine nucleosidase